MTIDNPYESPEKDSRSIPPKARPIGSGEYFLIAVIAISCGCIAFFMTCTALYQSGFVGIATILVGSFIMMVAVTTFIGRQIYGSLLRERSDSTENK